VECTINGLGERAGNTSLEEVVMAFHTRRQFFNLTTGIDTTQIYPTSRMVSNCTGITVQPNKAIVGANAFAHEAGIHQDGILKHSLTYEIMGPETIGLTASNLVLGKHSGRHAFRVKLEDLGYGHLSPEDINRVFERFKELSDKKKVVSDRDIETIIADEIYTPDEVYALEHVQVSCGDRSMPTATVRLRDPLGQVLSDAATGTGPVDAVYKAINRTVNVPNNLIEFSVRAVTEGIDAQGKVTIRIQTPEGMGTDAGSEGEGGRRIFSGSAADTDIIVASARAYMNALNKLLTYQRDRTSPSPSKKGN
jgi:2-isopropylmalate synthase